MPRAARWHALVLAFSLTVSLLIAGFAPVAAQDGTPAGRAGTPSATPLPAAPVGE